MSVDKELTRVGIYFMVRSIGVNSMKVRHTGGKEERVRARMFDFVRSGIEILAANVSRM